MTVRRVGRFGRALDAASLGLILVGGLVYLRSYLGMRQIRDRVPTEFVRGQTVLFGGIAEYARLEWWAKVGLTLAGAGIVVGLSAAAHAHIIARRGVRPLPPKATSEG